MSTEQLLKLVNSGVIFTLTLLGASLLILGLRKNGLRKTAFGATLLAFATYLTIQYFPETGTTLSAFSTVALAVLAAFTVIENINLRKENRDRETREKKERLLSEIIEWAIDIIRTTWGFSGAIKEAMRPATEREQSLFRYAHVAEVKERFMQFIGRNIRITKVGSQFVQKLQEAIATLQKDLGEYIKFLDDWQGELQISIANNVSDKKENPEKADAYVRAINKSAADVIEKATET